MHYQISADRTSLTFMVTKAERKTIRALGHKADSDQALYEFFADIDLAWIDPADTGDLTSAPMLGILGEEGVKDITVFLENYGYVQSGSDGHNTFVQPILERWAFMDYQVRSVLGDLRDYGRAVFISG